MNNIKALYRKYHWASWLLLILLIKILVLLSMILLLFMKDQKTAVYYASAMDGSLAQLYPTDSIKHH